MDNVRREFGIEKTIGSTRICVYIYSLNLNFLQFMYYYSRVKFYLQNLFVVAHDYLAPGIFPRIWNQNVFTLKKNYVRRNESERKFRNVCAISSHEILCLIILIQFQSLTLERSTPVRAWTAGGTWPTRRVISELVPSPPPKSTISSVLANGAATSAAIWIKLIKKLKTWKQISFDEWNRGN